MKPVKNFLFAAALTALSAGSALAADPVEQHNSNALWFENWIGLSSATLTVSAPNGEITSVMAQNGTPVFELSGADVADGIYRYELTAATDEEEEIANAQNSGRGDDQRSAQPKPFYASGEFVVSRGVIVTPEEINEDS